MNLDLPRLLLIALTAGLLAGCTSSPPGGDDAVRDSSEPLPAPTPGPVDLDETVNLTLGGQHSWSFDVGADATSADIVFTLTPLLDAPAAAGSHVCFRYTSPIGQDSQGQCVGGGPNINISPGITVTQRVFFDLHAVKPGHYTFSVNAEPNPVELLAYAKVVQ